jgi:hypothetical protein
MGHALVAAAQMKRSSVKGEIGQRCAALEAAKIRREIVSLPGVTSRLVV